MLWNVIKLVFFGAILFAVARGMLNTIYLLNRDKPNLFIRSTGERRKFIDWFTLLIFFVLLFMGLLFCGGWSWAHFRDAWRGIFG